MNKLEHAKIEIENLVKNESKYNFSRFLSELRGVLGVTRRTLSNDLSMSYLNVLNLESGHFRKMPSDKILSKISEYYGVDSQILRFKADKFLKKLLEV
jgi:hypothetical protein